MLHGAPRAAIGVSLCLLVAVPAAAQVDVGVKAGIAVAGVRLTPAAPDVLGVRTESTLGIFAAEPTDRLVSWQVDVLIGPGGSTIDTPGERSEYRLTYLDLAPVARATAARLHRGHLYVLAGPAFGVLLSATEVEYTDDGRDVSNVADLFAALDIGITVGLGLELGRLVFEGRHRHGLTDISTVPPSVSAEIRTRATSVLFGFRF